MRRFTTSTWAVCGLTAALLFGCNSEQAPPEEILRPVRTMTVASRSSNELRVFSGTAKAGRETRLSFRVSGRIERLPVKVGTTVRRGQLVASLERKDFEISLLQADASVAQAEATARNAESNLDRIRGLWENENASQEELDSARANAESSRAQVEVAKQEQQAASRQLDYTRLYAPENGAIASLDVEISENVSQGQSVALLTSGDLSEVEVSMPEVLISEIDTGERVKVSFASLPGQDFQGTVTEVGVAAVSGSTTFPVTVQLNESNAGVRSGMAADVEFSFTQEATAGAQPIESIFIPAYAVGEDQDGRYVFVLTADSEPGVGVVRRQDVAVGQLNGLGELEITSGLDDGTEVVTAGVRRLRDGQRVRLQEAAL